MAEQLQMIWPESRMDHWPQWQTPAGYLLRGFAEGDQEPYIELMQMAGFDAWDRTKLNVVLKHVVPNGILFVQHEASSRIVATAMGWYKPSPLFPEAHEMGWVAADPMHRGRGLGQVVTAAATRALLEHGAKEIYLLTDDWRLPAIKGYLRVGYVPLYHRPDMRGRWREVFLELNLEMEEYAGVEIDMTEEDNPERKVANNPIDHDEQ
jgi:mycothiol synthase